MSADIASVIIDQLREENAALRAHAERVGQANDRLVVENAALRNDKDRLDYAEKHLRLSREALDVAMEVAKP